MPRDALPQIVGFLPRKVLDAITEAALDEVYRKVRDVETFITQIVNRSELGERSGKGSKSKSGKGKGMMDDEAEMREIDTVSHKAGWAIEMSSADLFGAMIVGHARSRDSPRIPRRCSIRQISSMGSAKHV